MQICCLLDVPLPLPLLQQVNQQQLRCRLSAELLLRDRRKRTQSAAVERIRQGLANVCPRRSVVVSANASCSLSQRLPDGVEQQRSLVNYGRSFSTNGLEAAAGKCLVGQDCVQNNHAAGSDSLQRQAPSMGGEERLAFSAGSDLRLSEQLLLLRRHAACERRKGLEGESEAGVAVSTHSNSPSGGKPRCCSSVCSSSTASPASAAGGRRSNAFPSCELDLGGTPSSNATSVETGTFKSETRGDEEGCVVLNAPSACSPRGLSEERQHLQLLQRRTEQRQQPPPPLRLRASLPLFSWSARGMAAAAAVAKTTYSNKCAQISNQRKKGALAGAVGSSGNGSKIPPLKLSLLLSSPSAGTLDSERKSTISGASFSARRTAACCSDDSPGAAAPAACFLESRPFCTEFPAGPRLAVGVSGDETTGARRSAWGELLETPGGKGFAASINGDEVCGVLDSLHRKQWHCLEVQGLEDRRRLSVFLRRSFAVNCADDAAQEQMLAGMLRSLEAHKGCQHPVVVDMLMG